MTKDAAARRIAQILTDHEIRASRCAEDGSFLVEHVKTGAVDSSAAVEIEFRTRGQDVLVVLLAPVLQNVTASPVTRFGLLERLNQLNSEVDFGKFYLEGDAIYLRYDLSSTEFTADELVKPLMVLARVADEQDDRLLQEFGTGLRAGDVIARFQELVDS